MNTGYISKFFIFLGLLICHIAWANPSTNTTKLTDIHISTQAQKTRITLTLTDSVTYKGFTSSNPPRITVDLSNVQLATVLSTVNLHNSPITHIEQNNPDANTLRLVFFLKQKLPLQVAMHQNQLVMDLTAPVNNPLINQPLNKPISTPPANNSLVNDNTPAVLTAEPMLAVTKPAPKLEPQIQPETKLAAKPVTKMPLTPTVPAETNIESEPAPLPPATVSTTRSNRNQPIVVVLDPGHGGKDPGTMGSMGVREKDVVLAISKYVAEILNQDKGFRAVLTRTDDYFIPLRGRLNIARKDHANMFVAIHADAYINSYATGASVFALSAHGASSEAARWLAEKENYSELGGVSLNDKSNVLRSVLIDLSQTATITSSLQLGRHVLAQLNRVTKLHRGFVEQAPFMVLKNPDIPSLLVETGFLSNPLEEQRLRDPYYQRKIAGAIAEGIKTYFQNNPPI